MGHSRGRVGRVKHEIGDIRSHWVVQADISPGNMLEHQRGRHHLGDGPDLAQHVRARPRRRHHTRPRCVGHRDHHALLREPSCTLVHNPLQLVHTVHPTRNMPKGSEPGQVERSSYG